MNVYRDMVSISAAQIPVVSINQDGKLIICVSKSKEYLNIIHNTQSNSKLMQSLEIRHFCECKPGFRAYQDPNKDGHTVCVDDDECELGTSTCHQSTKCWNTPGSYQCYCQHSNETRCSKGIQSYIFKVY